MPYLITDDDFNKFGEVLDELIEEDKISLRGRTLITVLLLILGQLIKVEGHDLTRKEITDKLGDDVEGVAIAASAAFASLLQHLSNEYGGVVMGKVNGVPWFYADELAPEACGFIPSFIKVDDERPMREQIGERYISGWKPFAGFKMKQKNWTIQYPGDHEMQPLGGAALHGEVIAVYPYGWTMIIQDDASFEIARLD